MKTQFKTLFISLLLAGNAWAGPGHDHGESAFAGNTGPADNFDLTENQMQNLDIRSANVELIPMQKTVDMLAFTEFLPERRATISPRFDGKIVSIDIRVGEKVSKGQKLVTLEPVNVGNNKVALRAPFDGIVLSLAGNLGQVINTGGMIMEIGDPSQMLVKGMLYETPAINQLQEGQQAEIHLDIHPGRNIAGQVQRINRVIDPESRTFSVYALINTPQGEIYQGLQGTMEVFTGDDKPVIAVPRSAVLGELGNYFVYAINGNHVEKRDVVVGHKSIQHVEIKNGLTAHEQVVIQGNYQLQYIAVGGVHDHDHEEEHNHGHEQAHEDEHAAEHNHEHDKHEHNHEHDDHQHLEHSEHNSHDHQHTEHSDHSHHDHSDH